MAELSDLLVRGAILAYLVAMLCHLVEYAFGRQGMVTRAAVREPALVGAGVAQGGLRGSLLDEPPVSESGVPRPIEVVTARGAGALNSGPAAVFGRLAVVLTAIAMLVHAAAVLTRGLAAERVPLGNMYEFVIVLSLVGTVTWLVLLLRRPALRLLGLFVSVALVLMLGFADMVLHTEVAPLVPALNSYWRNIHVTSAATASGLLLIAFIPAAMFLVRNGYDAGKRRFPYTLGRWLPNADLLDRLAFRLHVFAFPIWTFAIIAGAIWAEAAWGRYWGWDPKETWSFVSWVAYAAYLHARATPSVKRTTASWFAVAAWASMVINLYVINFVAVGLHSYAGVE